MGIPDISADRLIWNRLHIKRGDNLPYVPWAKNSSRITLAEMFNELGYKKGAEVGVRRGDYSRVICDKVPGVKLFCVDPWMPYRGRRPKEADCEAIYQYARELLKGFDVEFMRMTSMEAVTKFEDNSLDFVYIDAMHEFDPVMLDIIHWSQKVKPGGIVSGHDYQPGYNTGVVQAVNAYTYSHNINCWYVVGDHHGTSSWFWVKR